ncbi:MAG: sulfatase-like hydrolase/transferase [Planctomycetes bacterium]|nr:sulfatase-like hydrolase/transferase [Planctomycetota bacterium]
MRSVLRRPSLARTALLGALVLGACGERDASPPQQGNTRSAAPSSAAGAKPQNLLLLSLDTTRRDRLGFHGGSAATPTLDALARDGAHGTATFSPTPITLPSHATLLTGTYPPRHGVRDNGIFELGAEATTLAEVLREHGFRTGAVVSAFVLDAQFGLAQGFDDYDDRFESGGGGTLGIDERTATATTDAALRWLDTLDRASSPRFFLFAHYFDPHFPYAAPPEIAAAQPYDAELAYVDRELARLLAGLRARSLLESTLVLVTADHGEALGEHGEKTHGVFVYESTTAVPLVLHGPGVPAGARIEEPATLADVLPTALELLDLPVPSAVQGRSLVPALRGETQPARAIYLESFLGRYSFGWAPLRALVRDHWKFIAAPREELYDLRRDPREQRNLLAEEPARAEALRRELASLDEALRGEGASWARSRAEGADAWARLASLGYVSSPASERASEPTRDPKDGLPELELLERAGTAQEAQRLDEALRLYDELLARNPAHVVALQRSGIALLDAGRIAEGVARLEQLDLVQLPADQPMFRLAAAYAQLGKEREALSLFAELRRRNPKFVMAHLFFGQLHEAAGKQREATQAYREALRNWHGDAAFRAKLEQRIRGLEKR